MAKLTKEDEETIERLYREGKSYRDIKLITGFSFGSICKRVKGLRSLRLSLLLSRKQGKWKLTLEGQLSLYKHGIKACQRCGKFYTKPLRMFKDLLNEICIGVRFPDYVKLVKHVLDDNYESCLLFQYPIQRYVVDFVDIGGKIAININGDYWHANPLLYNRDKLGKLQQINIKQDENKRIFLLKNGWRVLDIWESEIYWNKESVILKLRAAGVVGLCMNEDLKMLVQSSHSASLDWSLRLKELWFKKDKKPRKKAERATSVCRCGKKFEYVKHKGRLRKYCSKECFRRFNVKANRPTKEQLKELVDKMSFIKLGKIYGVSDVTIKKWCKRYGIETGNRSRYWPKKRE